MRKISEAMNAIFEECFRRRSFLSSSRFTFRSGDFLFDQNNLYYKDELIVHNKPTHIVIFHEITEDVDHKFIKMFISEINGLIKLYCSALPNNAPYIIYSNNTYYINIFNTDIGKYESCKWDGRPIKVYNNNNPFGSIVNGVLYNINPIEQNDKNIGSMSIKKLLNKLQEFANYDYEEVVVHINNKLNETLDIIDVSIVRLPNGKLVPSIECLYDK